MFQDQLPGNKQPAVASELSVSVVTTAGTGSGSLRVADRLIIIVIIIVILCELFPGSPLLFGHQIIAGTFGAHGKSSGL